MVVPCALSGRIFDGHLPPSSSANVAPPTSWCARRDHMHVSNQMRHPCLRRHRIALARISWHCTKIKRMHAFVGDTSAVNPASAPLEEDATFMRQALDLARKGLGKTHPNPAVGCVIVKDGLVVGEGYHPRAGEPHAEVFALRAAGQRAVGATAYVTLEPCSHFGRTPPCSRALVAAGVARVVVGAGDPNPLVGGAGIATLEAAGIEVLTGVEAQACYDINLEFMERMAAAAAEEEEAGLRA